MHAVAETHDTPVRSLASARLGLGTTDQLVPSQDSIRVAKRRLPMRSRPTAVHAVAETHDTPKR